MLIFFPFCSHMDTCLEKIFHLKKAWNKNVSLHNCEKKAKSIHIFSEVSLVRHHYIHVFSKLALLKWFFHLLWKTDKHNINKKWINKKQNTFIALFPPSKEIFYKKNFHASMTNSVSNWRRRRSRRRKRWKRWSRWRKRDQIYKKKFSLYKLN
jgi:hypothetical protein